MVTAHHYLRKPPDVRSRPFVYLVAVQDVPVGCLFFGRTQSSSCFHGELTFGSANDVATGLAKFDRWEVLALSRLWLSPDVQANGCLCRPGIVPGFMDRKGKWRSALASAVIRSALAVVGYHYLMAHPPCFLDQPYAIRAILSYCDLRLHRGTIYPAAGFRLSRTNLDGIQTWWTPDVAKLTAEQDLAVREHAVWHPRSVRIRNRDRTLFDQPGEADSDQVADNQRMERARRESILPPSCGSAER